MKYLKDFKLFENNLDIIERWDTLNHEGKMGKLLYLYGAIPISRNNSYKVIDLILNKYNKKYDILNNKELVIDINDNNNWNLQNSLRFGHYFETLIDNKSTFGFNFEGTIVGFFGGKVSETKDSRYDVIINDKCYSIKTSSVKGGDSLVIGSFKNTVFNNIEYFKNQYGIDIVEEITKFKGLGYFLSDFYINGFSVEKINNIKNDLLDLMFSTKSNNIVPNKVDYIIIGFVDKNNPPEINQSYIKTYVISISNLKKFLMKKGGISPKTKTNIFQLRISKNILINDNDKNDVDFIDSKIIFKFRLPNNEELDELRNIDSLKWASKIFKGQTLSKMRPDVISDIYKDRHNIVKKLLKKYVSF